MTLRPAILCLCAALAACTAGPDYDAPILPVAQAWRQPLAIGVPSDRPWWQGFNDPVLDRLEAEALSANLTIEQALARLDQAQAAAGAAKAARLPSAEVGGTAARARQSLNSGLGQLSRYVPDLPRTVDSGNATVSGSWDLDFAGGLRRRQEAARAGTAEADAGVVAARLAVSAELAQAYFRMRVAQAQGTAIETLASRARERQAIMAARLASGAAARTDAERASASAEQALAALPQISAMIEAERTRIAILLGRSPSLPLDLDGAFAADAPDPVAGLPARVLRARPDVAMAEARLISANAAIGAALAEYWPSLSIGGLAGVQSNRFGQLFTGDSVAMQGALGLRWRLFDFGRIDAEVASARGRYREMLAAYREAVLRATGEVETAQATLMAARSALARTRAEAGLRLTARNRDEAAFRAGAISREALSVSESALAEADLRLAEALGNQAMALVELSRALGLRTS
ncbi:MAG: efflux transporter outer membrane subunit [Novosphingobium sp.]|nr:efflux transporter outer membrane subunit [Novosphingobium sp.]